MYSNFVLYLLCEFPNDQFPHFAKQHPELFQIIRTMPSAPVDDIEAVMAASVARGTATAKVKAKAPAPAAIVHAPAAPAAAAPAAVVHGIQAPAAFAGAAPAADWRPAGATDAATAAAILVPFVLRTPAQLGVSPNIQWADDEGIIVWRGTALEAHALCVSKGKGKG